MRNVPSRERSALRRLVLTCAFLLLCPLAGSAAPVAYDFTATVDTIVDPGGVLAGSGLLVGGNFDGFYTVESTTLDIDPDPTAGQYDGALLTTTLQLGAFTMVLDPGSGSTNRFWVVDGFDYGGTPIDGYAPVVIGADGTLGASVLSAGQLQVYLGSTDTTILPSDAMPASMPARPIGDWDQLTTVTVTGDVGGDTFQIGATVSGFPTLPVPEPSTGVILAAGLAALAVGRRNAR
ncbi:MAG: PEP-CTERM sorting domain-containing protein [Myxococcota bacterium]